MVIHLPSKLSRELIAPRLGGTAAVILCLYLWCGYFWSRLLENERAALLPTTIALALWISIRALLRFNRPPSGVLPSILVALHLLNLVVLILLLAFGLLGFLKGTWWRYWQ